MNSDEGDPPREFDQLLDNSDLAEALENERFKQFLDHLPIAIAVSKLQPQERIVYANPEFLKLTDTMGPESAGRSWQALPGVSSDAEAKPLGQAIVEGSDFIGAFVMTLKDGASHTVNAWSSLIEDDEGVAVFRLVALIDPQSGSETERGDIEQQLREKDMLLRELQHRVKNNLQMITALIRLESRQVSDRKDVERFQRLAGRVESLALLYQAMTSNEQSDAIDLGTYLSHIASAAMQAQAVEGIRLVLTVDSWPVSLNIAMPAGLVVNELMTNALKYAFRDRDSGTITVKCIVDDMGCKVVVADDGVGLPPEREWPEPGKLSALIVRSLRENAHAQLKVESAPGEGTTVTIRFTKAAAEVA